jgi:hypothetical protein
MIVVQNGYYDGAWKYATTNEASHYSQYNGAHRWFTAPSGTADSAITWTQAMTLDSSGNVGIGETSPLGKLHIKGSDTGATASAQGNSLVLEDTENGLSILSSTAGAGYINFGDSDDNNIGIIVYDHSSNSMRFWTNASERMRIDSGGNVGIGTSTTTAIRLTATTATANHIGLQVENSNTADSFGMVVKAGNDANDYTADFRKRDNTTIMRIRGDGNVGIGTTSPNISSGASGSTALTVSATTSGRNGLIELRGTRTSSGEVVSYLRTFNDSGATPLTDIQSIRGASDTVGQLAFFTSNAEAMRIDSSGNLLVGKTAVDTNTAGFEARSTGFIGVTRADVGAYFTRLTTDGEIIQFRKDSTTVGSISTEGGDLNIGTGDTGLQFADGIDAIRPFNITTNVDRDGTISLGISYTRFKDLYLSGGVYLGGTGAANLLDDYEEGTFTPTIVGGSTAGTASYSIQLGFYTKIGNVVYVYVNISWSSGTGSGQLRISGLPFTSSNTANLYPAITIAYSDNVAGTANNIQLASVPLNSTYIQFEQYPVGGGAASVLAYDAAGQFSVGGFYYV